jgi:hypothetical protein
MVVPHVNCTSDGLIAALDIAAPDTDLRLYEYDNSVDIPQKIILNTRRPNIKKVWVNGRLVKR